VIAPLERLLERLRGLLLDLGRFVDDRIESLVLELVDARQRAARRRVLPILAAVPLFRVDVVVRRARLEDVPESVALVVDLLFD